jgi:hypothetical protein
MSKVLLDKDGKRAVFHCPGCGEGHQVLINRGEHPVWQFNGDVDKPTFSPSILVRSGHYTQNAHPDDCWCNFKERFPNEGEPPFRCGVCHSFVTEGRIQFLGDCTHELAGQTVDLPEMAE